MRKKIGLSAALTTPFEQSGAIDWPRFVAHAGHLLAQGMRVVTAFGTTGEGVSISATVRATLYERTAAAGIHADRLIECVYGPSSQDAGDHVRRSLEAGCGGILLTPPFYFKQPTEEGSYRWISEVLERSGAAARDVILYNIPALTGVRIGPKLVARLRVAFPQAIAGVKDSSGDWEQTAALLAEHRDLAVLVGHEGHLARAVRQGASGAISGVANFAPALLAKLVRGEDDPLIDDLLGKLLKLPVVPAVKAVLAQRTGDAVWLRVRAPLEALGQASDLDACREIAAMVANGDGTAVGEM
ncbi:MULTISPECIES: dihydrodipicolinate synthase family protein [unclassified Mesorhizobium]|uniref:dihydrodipicolinate synthase family protein n=1 Tax=unclassified Mesorhizobium TaxID=325217 RepID=UPI001CCA00C0|nr:MULTISPECIES: dihydrodipicolinate synthase family protein [unclassified Mesorhizobium]MBZ9739860.1 dihydrodipicolinate synthase family protein [Mesorhizobium sp. CO1-1-4]MBZ9805671.1 dihydrodipicolinate synthase family protein [Mesorhizobium sp. ES1-6]